MEEFDLFVIGGGINGVGIARDAAGRGIRVGLAEMNDLGSATSSASTKLFHGGLRYLEYLEISLVRKALIERETLLRAMPHISWPMRFVLPYHKDMRFESASPVSRILNAMMPWMKGRRPGWLIRLGLFFYDHLGGREILPGTKTVKLTTGPESAFLEDRFIKAYEYSDCWIDDSRLVVLNARDAQLRGARIMVRTKVISAEGRDGAWRIKLRDQHGEERNIGAKMLVNAGGPWVGKIIRHTVCSESTDDVRLVRGSHIVTKSLFDHGKAYLFQGEDGRVIFAIPYETDFTLIGTTDADHADPDLPPICTQEERDYLIEFANRYIKKDISVDEVVWTYAGVRPLYDDGAHSATAATRDYVLTVDEAAGAPLLNIFGGKITTYRKLAEHAMQEIAPFIGATDDWTAGVSLPGGDFQVHEVEGLIAKLKANYPFLSAFWAGRLIRAYGRDAWKVLSNAASESDLGQQFGATLTAQEIRWLMKHEFARNADDIVWRRSKLGLRMSADEISRLDDWMREMTVSSVSI